MILYSPEPIFRSPLLAIVTKNMNVEIYDSLQKINIPKQISLLYFNEFRKNVEGNVVTEIPSIQIARQITSEEASDYYLFQSLLNHCISNAEVINRRLLDVLNSILIKLKKTEDLSTLDFMKLRDKLSEILKNEKKIDIIEELSSNGKVKQFNKNFFRYITDRNIYTHGELSLDIMNNRYVVHSKVNGKDDYYTVDRIIIESHIRYFTYMTNILNEIEVYFKNKN